MNYYNPYFMMTPALNTVRPGLFSSLRAGGLSLGTIINGTQKTLGLINQAIPVVKQVRPVLKNAKTMFKVMNEFRRTDTPNSKNNVSLNNKTTTNDSTPSQVTLNNDGPTFFV